MLCPKCHRGIPDGSRFCLECGSAVSSDSQAEAAQAAARADASLGDQNTLQGTSSPAATPPSAGSGVSLTERYELEVEIGRGGFAVVWKARDRRLGRTVAVKRLLSEATQGPGAMQTAQRFEREAQAIATLNHRNIVQVFDSDVDADGRYIVMEYVSGGTLRDYLKQRGKLPVAEAVALTIGLCRGLAAAHRQGLVHRDVKPANVLLDLGDAGGPVPRLVDFGLARQGRESDVSATGYGLGTPYYMAPEQRRDAKSVTHTADIYALGKTLYEMVTGEVPDSVDPVLVPPPEELGRIILKCIRSNPAERYFSAEDLLRDLEALGTGVAVSVAGAAVGSGTACPACTRCNPTDAKFCEACGTGLTRRCPECDRENALGLRFCGGCGSDVPVFLQARDALARMQSFAKELKWSRVTKEHGLLAKELRLPGEKGRKLLADLREVAQAAVAAERTLGETRACLAKAGAARDFKQALELCRQVLTLDPSDALAAARLPELEVTATRSGLLARSANTLRLVEVKQFIGARQAANEILEQATVLTQWIAPDPLLCPEGQTGAALRSQAENVLAAADQAVTAASASVQAGQAAMAEQDYHAALTKVDAALALCVDLPAATELRQQVETALDVLRQRIAKAHARVSAARDLVQAGRLADARMALAALVADCGDIEVPEDADVAPAWVAVLSDLAATEHELAQREPEAQQRLAARRRRQNLALAALAIMLLAGLGWWLGLAVTRHRAAAREQRIAAERQAAFEVAYAEGDRLLAAKRWAEAEVAFRQAQKMTGREQPNDARIGLGKALAGAAQAACATACAEGDRFLEAERWGEAEGAFSRALAVPGYESAARPMDGVAAAKAGELAAETRAAYRVAVASAQQAVGAGDWTTAEQEVAKALALDSMGSDALALAAKLEPTLTITAELDGQEVAGAQIAIDGAVQQETTPASYKLERGKTYVFSVSLLPKDGRFYTIAETGVTADWHGPKTWSAKVGVEHGPAEGQAWTVAELGLELLWVAPGSFQMGSEDGGGDEKPVHAVKISRGFWLGRYEVTQAEYEAVAGINPSVFKGARRPVEKVSWDDAVAFCAKLTERERAAGRLPPGHEYRLPTEAEWEYAARGGTASKGYSYAGSNNVAEVAWYGGNSGTGNGTLAVGRKKANELGLFDMTGNVWEWCLDGYDAEYYGRSPNVDPANAQGAANRVLRGGSWCDVAPQYVRSACRFQNRPDGAGVSPGFRVCLGPQIEGP